MKRKLSRRALYNKVREDIEKLRAPEGYLWAGLPRFRKLFGRDSCISAWQSLDIEPEIAKNTLYALAKRQGKTVHRLREEEPGKILHECPVTIMNLIYTSAVKKFRWRFPYYGSIDSTAWFLILLGMYVEKTNDIKLLNELWPNVKRALDWINNYSDADNDGFIKYERKNPYGLMHQGWKDGRAMNAVKIRPPVAVVEAQGYYYAALLAIERLARKIGEPKEFCTYLEHKALLLKKSFIDAFWMPKEQYFAFALDGEKNQIKTITSNPGHLLFTGILDREYADCVVQRLFTLDMWTYYGIRTLSENDTLFDPYSYHLGSVWPHDNWIIHEGLKKYGYFRNAERIKNALINAVTTLDHIPELYGVKNGRIQIIPKACKIQAWACCAILQLLSEKS